MYPLIKSIFGERFPERAGPAVNYGDDGVYEVSFEGFTFRLGTERGSGSMFTFFTSADGLEAAVGSGFNGFEAADYFYSDETFHSQWENLSNKEATLEIERAADLIERLRRLDGEERGRLVSFIQGHQFGSATRYRMKASNP